MIEINNILPMLIIFLIINIIVSNIPLLTTNNLLGKEFNSVDEENLEDEEE